MLPRSSGCCGADNCSTDVAGLTTVELRNGGLHIHSAQTRVYLWDRCLHAYAVSIQPATLAHVNIAAWPAASMQDICRRLFYWFVICT